MEIKYLKEFVVLAKELSFSSAAECLFISQPALSKHIMALEKELGAALFDRTSREVKLSDLGKLYLPYATKIVTEYENAERKRLDFIDKYKSSLHIGSVENLQIFGIDEYLIEFKRRYPAYKIKITEASNNRLQEMFEDGHIKLFTSCIPEGFNCSYSFCPLMSGHIVAYVSTEHVLSKRRQLDIKSLVNEQLFLPPQGTRFLSMIENIFKEYGIHPDAPFYGSYEAAISFAEANIGIALLPSQALPEIIPEKVKAIELTPGIRYLCGVGYKEKGLNTAEQAFIEYVSELAIKL